MSTTTAVSSTAATIITTTTPPPLPPAATMPPPLPASAATATSVPGKRPTARGLDAKQRRQLIIIAAVVTPLVGIFAIVQYFSYAEPGKAVIGAIVGLPLGAIGAALMAVWRGGHRRKAACGPVPLIQYTKGYSALRDRYMSGYRPVSAPPPPPRPV